jgi:hypothetical protein
MEVKPSRKCKNCQFHARTREGIHLCLLGSNEHVGIDLEGYIVAGVVVDPKGECLYPPSEKYISYTPLKILPLL